MKWFSSPLSSCLNLVTNDDLRQASLYLALTRIREVEFKLMWRLPYLRLTYLSTEPHLDDIRGYRHPHDAQA
jgi:hypothetical protein